MAAEEGQVVSVHSVDAWTELLQKANDSKKLMVVDFTASWCGPCRVIAPFLSDLAKKLPNVIFAKIDVDELKLKFFVDGCSRLGYRVNADLHVSERRNILDKVVGAQKEALADTVAKHLTTVSA